MARNTEGCSTSVVSALILPSSTAPAAMGSTERLSHWQAALSIVAAHASSQHCYAAGLLNQCTLCIWRWGRTEGYEQAHQAGRGHVVQALQGVHVEPLGVDQDLHQHEPRGLQAQCSCHAGVCLHLHTPESARALLQTALAAPESLGVWHKDTAMLYLLSGAAHRCTVKRTSNSRAASCCTTPLTTRLTSPRAQTTTPKAMSAMLAAVAPDKSSAS